MTAARVQLRNFSLRRRAWWLFVHVPAILMCAILLTWGLDVHFRTGQDFALVWLVMALPMWAFLAALFVIPVILLIQYLAETRGASATASTIGQVIIVAILGATFAFTTEAMSIVAGTAMGALAAAGVALLPVLDPEKHWYRAS